MTIKKLPVFGRVLSIVLLVVAFQSGVADAQLNNLSNISRLKWHIAQTQFPSDNFIVTPYYAKDFGIIADGITDVTKAIQAALDSLSNLGGGALFLPSGKYKVAGTLTIPSRVTLRGDWKKPEIGSPIQGTILEAYAGRGDENGTAFILLSDCSGVKGIAIWYPEQLPTDIQPYPPAIQRSSGGNHTVENVTFVNAYFGFTTFGSANTTCPFIRNVYGTPLKTGIELDCIVDVGRIETVQFSPDFWKDSGLPNAPALNEHSKWIYENGTGIILRRIDWSYSAYVTVKGYNIGLAARPSRRDQVTPQGQCYGFTLENCKTGIYFENSYYPGFLCSRFNIQGAETGIHFSITANQPALFHTCSINASDFAVLNEGSGQILMQNCIFQKGKIQVNDGYITIVNSDFESAVTTHIELGSNVKGASILGNSFSGGAKIINITTSNFFIDNTALKLDPMPAYNYKKPDKQFNPAKPNLFVITQSPYNAKSDGITDDAPVFQRALADAASNGGGIVFVPGGDYRLNSNLTIPSGVELRGVFDGPHTLSGRGSVLNIYPGRNDANGTPFIQIEHNAGIRGLTFHYPEQIYNRTDSINFGMVPYPFMICGLGSDIYVINIAATIPYQLLDLATYRCDNHYVDYILSTALKTGIQVGKGSVDGQIHNCQFNPYAYTFQSGIYKSIPSRTSSGIHQYLWKNSKPYIFGNMSGEILHQNFVFAGLYGVHLVKEGGFGPSGHCLGMGIDQCTTALLIDDVGSAGLDFINSQLVTVDKTVGHYVEVGSSFTEKFRLLNTACWGNPNESVVVNNGVLELQLFHLYAPGSIAYDIKGTGRLRCIGGTVMRNVGIFNQIEATSSVEYIANIIKGQIPSNSLNVKSFGNLKIK